LYATPSFCKRSTMSNRLSSFIKKKLLGKNKNLVSLDDPYHVMACFLKGTEVTGIIDAGASNGRISRRFLRNFPEAHVYGFEPNMLYAVTLQQYAKEDSRFHPQFLALSDHVGTADLHTTVSPGSTSLFTPGERLKEIDPHGVTLKSSEKVQVVTIDHWVENHGSPAIQLMKFDIQGGELRALRGAACVLQNSTLLVYTEILFNPLYKNGSIFCEIDLFLREYGFVLYDIYKPKYDPKGLLLWGNAIYLHSERLSI
jgi:FkbM family methyltransferase